MGVSETTAYHWRWAALSVLLVAEAMNLLDATIVQVAAPVIHAHLPGPAADLQWFSAAYTLPFAVALMLGGRLGDMFGRKRVFHIGIGGFVVASLACALAPSASFLIAARMIQGGAAALIIPQTYGLIRAMFDGNERARALGSIGPVMGLAAVLGPVLGGVLTHADVFGTSWRAVFLVNVPLGLAVLAAVPLLREDRATRRPGFDVGGTLLAAGAMGLLIYPVIQSSAFGWTPQLFGLLVTGGVLGLGFWFHQRWIAQRVSFASGLLDPRLIADRVFSAALVCVLLVFAVITGLTFVIELQLQISLRADVLTGGLSVVPWSLASGITSWVAGTRLVPRYGPGIMRTGLLILAFGLALACGIDAVWPAGVFPWPLLLALCICGVGSSTFTLPFFTLAFGRTDAETAGSASGLLNSVQELGSTLGIAALGAAYFAAPVGWSASTALGLALVLVIIAIPAASAMLKAGREPLPIEPLPLVRGRVRSAYEH